MEHIFKQLKENWVILLFLASVVVSWTMFSARLSSAENDILDLRIIESKNLESLQEIRIDLAIIKEHVSNIDKKIQ